MPQMAPLSWTLLFCVFLALYLLITTKIYFTSVYSLTSMLSTSELPKKTYTWKW